MLNRLRIKAVASTLGALNRLVRTVGVRQLNIRAVEGVPPSHLEERPTSPSTICRRIPRNRNLGALEGSLAPSSRSQGV